MHVCSLVRGWLSERGVSLRWHGRPRRGRGLQWTVPQGRRGVPPAPQEERAAAHRCLVAPSLMRAGALLDLPHRQVAALHFRHGHRCHEVEGQRGCEAAHQQACRCSQNRGAVSESPARLEAGRCAAGPLRQQWGSADCRRQLRVRPAARSASLGAARPWPQACRRALDATASGSLAVPQSAGAPAGASAQHPPGPPTQAHSMPAFKGLCRPRGPQPLLHAAIGACCPERTHACMAKCWARASGAKPARRARRCLRRAPE